MIAPTALYLVIWSVVKCPTMLWWVPPQARPYLCQSKREYLFTEDRAEAVLKLQDLGPGGAELALRVDGILVDPRMKAVPLEPRWRASLPE